MSIRYSRLVKTGFHLALAFLTILYYAPIIMAQDDILHNEISSSLQYAPRRSAENLPGTVTFVESNTEYTHELKLFDKLPVELSIGNRYIDIIDSTTVKLPTRLVGWTADIETYLPFFTVKDTYIGLGVRPSLYSASWDIGTSAFRIPSRYFLIYRPSDKLTLAGGVGVYPYYKNTFFPIVGVIYKPTDNLTFNLTPDNPNISYAFNDVVSIFCNGDISFSEFKVEHSNMEDVVLRYREWHIGGGLEFKYKKSFRASASAGGTFGRRLEYSDDTSYVSIKDGFYTELKASLLF